MKRKILISQDANEKQVAVLEEGRLEEFYIERADKVQMFGNIYKGRVKTVIPGMGAAFVDLGTKKDGFLYVADALRSPMDLDAEFDDTEKKPPKTKRQRGRHKKIEEVLKVGQEIIVQVVKEPLGTKGPRLTTHFSIPARYLVMMPGESKIGVSRRIEDRRERERIREIFAKLEIPKGVGFIVRTAGEGKSDKEFARDIRYLTRLWKKVHSSIAQKKVPNKIHEELTLVERIIRDHYNEDDDQLIVGDRDVFRKVKRFLNIYIPGQKKDVSFYQGKLPLFEKYDIEKEIDHTLDKVVYLKSGGHIVVEQTEGLVAIDVNTGKFTGKKELEETVFKTNCEAAEEIARQLRLRDVGGIIIIDFIDMERYENRRNLMKTFNRSVKRDRAKTNVLKMSELGLIEMTRQRMRPSLESEVNVPCSYCRGSGMVRSSTSMAIQAVKDIRKSLVDSRAKVVDVRVHPETSERLLNQEKKSIRQLERAHRSKIHVYSDASLHVEDVNISLVK